MNERFYSGFFRGPQGWMLRDIATPESHLARIYKVINGLKQHYMRTGG